MEKKVTQIIYLYICVYVCICIYMYIYMYVYVYVFDAVLPTPIRGKGVCLRISHFDSIIRCETPGSSDT